MTNAPVYYANNPTSGTTYYSPMWCGCVSSGESIQVEVQAWSGTNGTGSLVSVTTLFAQVWDQTSNAGVGSGFTESSGNTAITNNTTTSGHWIKASGTYTGSGAGSLAFTLTYSASSAFIPTVPTFSPSAGGVGTAVTLTGTHFTDATIVKFNGVSVSSFVIVSDTSITTTVPTGATTGPITVGNPAGTVNSSTSYIVAQAWINTGTAASPNWVSGPIVVNTGTPASPVWTTPSSAGINTGTAASPTWTPGH